MAWNKELPKEIYTVIDKAVEKLEKQCKPVKILHPDRDYLENKTVIESFALTQYSKDQLLKLATYFYRRGIVDRDKATNSNREIMVRQANETVWYYEARIHNRREGE